MFFGKNQSAGGSIDLVGRVRAILESDAVRTAFEERGRAEKTMQDATRMANEGEDQLREAEKALKGLREELDVLTLSSGDATDVIAKITRQEARIESIRRGLERSPRAHQIAMDRQEMCRDRYIEVIKGALRSDPEFKAAQERLDTAIAEANKFMREWPEAVHAAFREAGEFFHPVDAPMLSPSDNEAWALLLRLIARAPRYESSAPPSAVMIPVALRSTYAGDGRVRGTLLG